MRAVPLKLLPVALLLAAGLACNVAQKVKQGVEQAGQPKVVRSADGRFQLTVPGSWREDPELHEEAEIEVSNRLSEMYVVVLTESREDFADNVDLAEFASMSRGQLTSNIQEPEATEPVSASVGGYPAMQYTMNGVVDNLKAAYIVTLVETPEHYHQIVAWTLRSRFGANEAGLRGVIQSFKEAAGPAAPPAGGAQTQPSPASPDTSPRP